MRASSTSKLNGWHARDPVELFGAFCNCMAAALAGYLLCNQSKEAESRINVLSCICSCPREEACQKSSVRTPGDWGLQRRQWTCSASKATVRSSWSSKDEYEQRSSKRSQCSYTASYSPARHKSCLSKAAAACRLKCTATHDLQ